MKFCHKIPKYITFYNKILINCSNVISRGVLGYALDNVGNFGHQFESYMTDWRSVTPSLQQLIANASGPCPPPILYTECH